MEEQLRVNTKCAILIFYCHEYCDRNVNRTSSSVSIHFQYANSWLPLFCRYFSYIVDCKDPKACTIVLRGAGKDFLMEVERNLQDAMNVARNVMVDARLVPGGGATEMAVAYVSDAARIMNDDFWQLILPLLN